jgi:hypothetical protein
VKKLVYTYSPLNGMIINHSDYDVSFTNIVDINDTKWYITDSSNLKRLDEDKSYKFSLESGVSEMDITDPVFTDLHLEEITVIKEKILMYGRLNDLKNTLMLKTTLRPGLFNDFFRLLVKREIDGITEDKSLLTAMAARSDCTIDDVIEKYHLKEKQTKSFFCYIIQVEKEISQLINEQRFDEARAQIRTSFETMRL